MMEVRGEKRVGLRRFPFPYRALFALCSDLDETPDGDVYVETMRFLNTTENTRRGRGVGLEVGNTIYFDMPPDQFSYWNTDEAGRAIIRELIRSGHIDCLHSFGDLATTRAHAERALDDLCRHGCGLEVWVDHAVAPSNFGGDIMCGLGDVPGSAVYHADLTCAYGVQYVWRGRVTSAIGQDVPRRLGGVYNLKHPVASARTAAKELAKGVVGDRGKAKYAMHGPNEVLRQVRLRSGQTVFEFMRSNPYWGGVSQGDTAESIAYVLTRQMLDLLVEREGVCILYTHLGKIADREKPFSGRTRAALARLAHYSQQGKILVSTTRRLLGYCRARREVALATSDEEGGIRIDVTLRNPGAGLPLREADLAGLCVYVPQPARTRVTVNGREVADLRRNDPDHTGRPSVSLPWRPLEFPKL